MINVLMSTYNGGKYVKDQIESILNQQEVDIFLTIRDDGSTDETLDILNTYNCRDNVNVIIGKNIGCGKSFWELLKLSEEAEYYAFCDQDDVWLPQKLSAAIKRLEGESSIPLLYCTSTIVVDEKLNVINYKESKNEEIKNFNKALVKATAAGCTYVFNIHSMELLKLYELDYDEIHDWAAYKIISCFGKVIKSNISHIYYRQHGNNLIGAETNSLRKYFQRIRNIDKNNSIRSGIANKILDTYSNIPKQNEEVLQLLIQYKSNNASRRKLLKIYKTEFNFIEYMYLKLLILNKKL